ncbi:COX15/CtaA family protein [Subtercola boreus]|uniref:Heme A synthase n=1 Tax=Subtercola boreus TaxID=120213 RepID=A0A3E0WCC7_9MICO|nr:COX15/CtaA family protein [Subtercola boreus]RFA21243.1 heme A synthase [Subtercola boreus]RFA21626.1 heme A synthase [Subtercola boreus]RFA27596.1 heme A synthase [Subtercola boreus]
MKRLYTWLPTTVDRRVRLLAWASLVVQIVLIGTGGAVRLTGSGLGCPTWPQCTDGSFVSTPEMGVHGIIEFTNRLLTFVVVLVSIAAFVIVLRMRRERRDLFVLTLLQGLSIPLQAVIGGITVLTGLNPYIVGLHFVVSIGLVVVTAMLVYRVHDGTRGAGLTLVVPAWYLGVARAAAVFVGLAVALGILTTGSGPHAGDAATPRNGLNTDVMEHLHSYPAYVLFALTVLLVVVAVVRGLPRRWPVTLLAVEVAQIAVGLTQSRLGLPPALVIVHMLLAACLVAAMTATLLAERRSPAAAPAAPATAAPLAPEAVAPAVSPASAAR